MANIMITTGSSFEGYEIESYLGIVTGQAAVGSNLIKGIAGGVSDSSEQDVASLENSNEEAIEALLKVAAQKKANAIIGMKLSYAMFASNTVGIVATGTAVVLKKKEIVSDRVEKSLLVTNYYTRVIPRPVKVNIEGNKNEVCMSVMFFNYNKDDILAIRADVELTNLYDEKLVIKGVDFVFEKGNVSEISSAFVRMNELSVGDVLLLKDAKVIVNKYVTTRGINAVNDTPINVTIPVHRLEALKKKRGIDAVEKYKTDGTIWTCNCGCVNEAGADECVVCGRKQEEMERGLSKFNPDEMLARMNEKEYVIEIKDVLMDYIKVIDPEYRLELLEIMESGLQYEKTRGNMKDTVIEKVEKVFEGH